MFYVNGVQAYHYRSNEKAWCVCASVPARVPRNGSRLLTAKMPWRKSKIWADNADKNSRRHLHQDPAPSIALLLLPSPHFVVAPDNSSFFAPDIFLSILTYISPSLISGNTGVSWRGVEVECCICVGVMKILGSNKWGGGLAVIWGHCCMLTTAKHGPCSCLPNTSCMVPHHK